MYTCRYDVRKSSLIVAPTAEKVDTKKTQGAHWADEKALDRRAFFRVSEDPAILALQNVNEKDGALYKCRVDFKKSPTRNYKVNLTIIRKYNNNILMIYKISTYSACSRNVQITRSLICTSFNWVSYVLLHPKKIDFSLVSYFVYKDNKYCLKV